MLADILNNIFICSYSLISMPAKKRQHYVPKLYLKFFSKDGYHLFLYNSELDKLICSNITDLCQSKYFYGSDLEVENSLEHIENEQAKVLTKIINQQSLDNLNDENKFFLLLFLLLQYTRTKKARDSTIEWIEDFFNDYILPYSNLNSEIKIDYPAAHHLGMLTAYCGVELIRDLRPFLLLNNTEKSYICSDAPVVLHNYIKIKNKYCIGFQSPGLQIFCPLNEKIHLLLIDPLFYSLNVNDDHTIILTDDSDIDEINKLQIFNCLHNFFFSEESQLEDMKKLYFEVESLKCFERVKLSEHDKISGVDHKIITFNKARNNYNLKLSFLKLNHEENRKFKGMVKRSLKANKLVFERNPEICKIVSSRINDNLTRAMERESSNNISK